MHNSHLHLQSRRLDTVPRLQLRRSAEMVPDRHRPHRHDLHLHQSPPVPQHSRIHHLQEPDHHPDRLRRGAMVRWQCDWHGVAEFWAHGAEQRDCGVGRYPTCARVVRWGQHKRRGSGEDFDIEFGIHMDAGELLLLRDFPLGHAEADQAHALQGL